MQWVSTETEYQIWWDLNTALTASGAAVHALIASGAAVHALIASGAAVHALIASGAAVHALIASGAAVHQLICCALIIFPADNTVSIYTQSVPVPC